MILYTVSIHSGTPAQCAKVVAEMEASLGFSEDPLVLLMIAEEEYDREDIPSLRK